MWHNHDRSLPCPLNHILINTPLPLLPLPGKEAAVHSGRGPEVGHDVGHDLVRAQEHLRDIPNLSLSNPLHPTSRSLSFSPPQPFFHAFDEGERAQRIITAAFSRLDSNFARRLRHGHARTRKWFTASTHGSHGHSTTCLRAPSAHRGHVIDSITGLYHRLCPSITGI